MYLCISVHSCRLAHTHSLTSLWQMSLFSSLPSSFQSVCCPDCPLPAFSHSYLRIFREASHIERIDSQPPVNTHYLQECSQRSAALFITSYQWGEKCPRAGKFQMGYLVGHFLRGVALTDQLCEGYRKNSLPERTGGQNSDSLNGIK